MVVTVGGPAGTDCFNYSLVVPASNPQVGTFNGGSITFSAPVGGTALLAGVSVASIVVGLAAQNTLSNLVAGFSLLLYRPFHIGDRVQLGTPRGASIGTVCCARPEVDEAWRGHKSVNFPAPSTSLPLVSATYA